MLYDVVILGGGAAGMAAGIYAARGKMNTLLIEQKRQFGGQCATTLELENYPGFPETTGPELMERFREHCEKFGVVFQRGKIQQIQVGNDGFTKSVILESGEKFSGKSIVVATGAEPRILGIKGEREFRGKGVAYCATCDADFYEDLDIVVVGSGNTAVEESLYLTKFVNSITMVVLHREGVLDADKLSQEKAFDNKKIKFVWNSVVEEIEGKELVESVKVKNIKTGEMTSIPCNGVFMFVGIVPQTEFLKGVIDMTPQGHIIVGARQETSVPGVFATGDASAKFLWQVVTAASDGAVAAVAAQRYVEEEEYWQEKVVNNPNKVLVLFWSPLDKNSVPLMNELEKFVANRDTNLVTVDTYKNVFMKERYDIDAIPTVLVFEQGRELLRKIKPGEKDLKELYNAL